jgi:hypothetical protein
MSYTRVASDVHDKVYTLLGIGRDNPG